MCSILKQKYEKVAELCFCRSSKKLANWSFHVFVLQRTTVNVHNPIVKLDTPFVWRRSPRHLVLREVVFLTTTQVTKPCRRVDLTLPIVKETVCRHSIPANSMRKRKV